MILCAASPSVCLGPRRRLSAPLFDLSALGAAEPVVVTAESGVDGLEVRACVGGFEKGCRSGVEGSGGHVSLGSVVDAELVDELEFFGSFDGAETFDEGCDCHGECRRVGVGWVLRLKL